MTQQVEHVDAVVVGSGFGGAVAAWRLAEAGRQTVLLERGKAWPPGQFPRSPRGVVGNMWDPSAGLHGMFDIWSFKGIEAVVSSGLGGGSLIYANVLLRKDEHWFVDEERVPGCRERWPISYDDLLPHYDHVEPMLDPHTHPYDSPKTVAFEKAANDRGLDVQRPPLAVTFAVAGQKAERGAPLGNCNRFGVHRQTCRLCGECDIGCNYGAKNTTDLTFLSASSVCQHVDVRTRCEVRGFEPAPGGGYLVQFVCHEGAPEGRPVDTDALPLKTLHADRLVLAAGTLGSTFLLLRNRAAFPRLSPRLGSRFNGNGDLLGFVSGAPAVLDPSDGPVITSRVRIPDRVDGGTGLGFYVEDGGYPELVNWVVSTQPTLTRLTRIFRFAATRLWARVTGNPRSVLSSDLATLLGRQATAYSMVLLGMGRDVPDGNMRLREGWLDVDWTTRTSLPYFRRVRDEMAGLASELGGRFQLTPLWDPIHWFRRVITVHPLGGCPMGVNPNEGVVDSHGEVFGYPGLFVADGSVMPGPVGANPSLTIAALADRAAERFAEPLVTA